MNKRVCDTKVTHKQTGEVPGSSYSSFRSEPVNLGTLRATPAFFPLPNAAPDISSSFSSTSLRLSGECGPCSCASQPQPRLSDCHRLYPGTGSAVAWRLAQAAQPRWLPSSHQAIGHPPHWPGRQRPRAARHPLQREGYVLCRFWPDLSDSDPPRPPPRVFPRAVSAACQRQSTAPSSSHPSTNSAHIFSNNPICAHR